MCIPSFPTVKVKLSIDFSILRVVVSDEPDTGHTWWGRVLSHGQYIFPTVRFIQPALQSRCSSRSPPSYAWPRRPLRTVSTASPTQHRPPIRLSLQSQGPAPFLSLPKTAKPHSSRPRPPLQTSSVRTSFPLARLSPRTRPIPHSHANYSIDYPTNRQLPPTPRLPHTPLKLVQHPQYPAIPNYLYYRAGPRIPQIPHMPVGAYMHLPSLNPSAAVPWPCIPNYLRALTKPYYAPAPALLSDAASTPPTQQTLGSLTQSPARHKRRLGYKSKHASKNECRKSTTRRSKHLRQGIPQDEQRNEKTSETIKGEHGIMRKVRTF